MLICYVILEIGLFQSHRKTANQKTDIHHRKSLKPIFHCEAKYLASGVGVGQCARCQNFALEIPTCWYILALPNAKICVTPDTKPKICVIPDASQWNIGCVRSQRKMLALAMYISCFLCRFHLRLVPKANPISSGIWA